MCGPRGSPTGFPTGFLPVASSSCSRSLLPQHQRNPQHQLHLRLLLLHSISSLSHNINSLSINSHSINSPVANQQSLQNVCKIILYILLGLSALGGLFTFFGSFSYFGGWFNKPLLGLMIMLQSGAIIAISVIAIMRMAKNEKFAFLTIAYFAIAFLFNLLGLILVSGYGGYGVFSFLTGIGGLAVAVLASIPVEKVGDPQSYKALMAEATQLDYILLGVYAVCSLITMIMVMSFVSQIKSAFRI